jgi:tetratricopeptide (TPR) repeat protein
LQFLGRNKDAYECFYKATWNVGWAAPSFHSLAELDSLEGAWETALRHLDASLAHGTENLRARALKVHILLKLGQNPKALIQESLQMDPLDPWMRSLAGKPWRGNNGTRLDVAFDLSRAGLYQEARDILKAFDAMAGDGSGPMVHYTSAWISGILGDTKQTRISLHAARKAAPDYCFPSRLEEIQVLESALSMDATDARAHFFLGCLLYDRRRHHESITHWKATVANEPSNAVAWRCLGIAFFNNQGDVSAARKAFLQARKAAPGDARLFFEADQLAKRTGEKPSSRLRVLRRHLDLVRQRDDLTVELCALLNQTGEPSEGLQVLNTRTFQPWEGGEGQALGQYVRCCLLLGRRSLAAGDFSGAITHFENALRPPLSLGETKHLLANQSDIHFWLGEAHAELGQHGEARKAWQQAAEFRGDFQNMSVCTFSEMSYYSAMAVQRQGDRSGARRRFEALLNHARELENSTATIDYFATSLPTMLLFDEDIQDRQTTTARFLKAQALLGLGRRREARAQLEQVLARDPNHPLAADFLPLTKAKP